MATSIPGIFACGDVRHQLVRQVTNAVGDATTAAMAASKYIENLRMPRRPQLVPVLAAIVVVIWTAWLISCSDDSSTKPVKLSYRIHDANLKAGYHCFCWNQHNQKGELVKVGVYQAHMQAGLYDTTIVFTISGGSSSVAAPPCCDSATAGTLKPSNDPPDHFALNLNDQSYRSGDSVAVDFELPVSCNCKILIEER